MSGQYLQFEGQIYNVDEIRGLLKGTEYVKECPLEELLYGAYKVYGPGMVKYLRGEFAFSILDRRKETIYLFRDRLGVQTLYYAIVNGMLVYSSNLGKILAYPGVKATLDREGACELFGMGPARTPGKTPFKGIYELLPGSYLMYNERGCQTITYWKLETKRHTELEEDTVEESRELLRQGLKEALPKEDVAVLLSGGLDSSYLAQLYREEKGRVHTYSLDFPESQKYFNANSFQPGLDRPYVDIMVGHLGAEHTYVWCDVKDQVAGLIPAMRSHNLPCMADIQTTFDFFCQEVGKNYEYVLTGECADEIFGGYPWFHKEEYLHYQGFPWCYSLEPRLKFLRKDVREKLSLEEYCKEAYETACKKITYLEEENEEERILRKNSYLTIYYFMQTLIRRTDIASKQAAVKAIVPFANPKLVEYAYNIPWKFKKKDGVRKYILRKAASTSIPESIYNRPKSPYPKDYNPAYKQMLIQLWEKELEKECPVFQFLDKEAWKNFIRSKEDFETPWFGQLMKGNQMMAYMLQVNQWIKDYNVTVDLK